MSKKSINTTYIIIGIIIVIGLVLFIFKDSIFGKKYISMDEVESELEKIFIDFINKCGGMNTSVTKECYNIAITKLPKVKKLLNTVFTLNDPNFTEKDKEDIQDLLNFINKLEPQLTDNYYENNIKEKTLEKILTMFDSQMLEDLQG